MEKYVRDNQFLNDDCLEEILSRLSLKDLIIASDVSIQFRRITQEIVRTKRSNIKLKDVFPEATLPGCEHFLETFGSLLKGFSIDAISLQYQVREWKFLKLLLEHFGKNCRLEDLELENFYGLSIPTLNLFSPIFDKLKKLSLIRISLPITIPFLIYKWPNIKELSLVYCHRADERSRETTRLLPQYPLTFQSDMKKLELMRNSYMQILPLIAEAPRIFTELEELSVHPALYGEPFVFQLNFLTTMVNLTRIPTLKVLKVDLEFKNMTILLEAIANQLPLLNVLEISYANYHQSSIDQFHKLQNLQTLRLFYIHGLKKHHIRPIIRGLPNLTTLTMHCRINMRTLINIVREAPKLILLDVEMHSKYTITNPTIETLLRILKTQQRDKRLCIKIYNHNIKSMTTKELKIVNDHQDNPFLHITRWP